MLGINNSLLIAPEPDQLEITLFGPGYGEAAVCHLGNGIWMTVDSCLDPETRSPVAALYLRALGADLASAVRLVVATHFDNDHTSGLADLVEECKESQLWISSALRLREFMEFVCKSDMLAERKIPIVTKEIRRLMNYLVESKRVPLFASANKDMFFLPAAVGGHGHDVRVRALSPGAQDEYNAKLGFAAGIPAISSRVLTGRSVLNNDYSVVIWIDAGSSRVLLGADLEQSADADTGWTAVLASRAMLKGRADVFKLPHHGSENGHNHEVWSNLLQENPVAMITPYNRAVSERKLPTVRDIQRILALTPNAHITRDPRGRVGRKVPHQIDKLIKRAPARLTPIPKTVGAIRARARLAAPDPVWSVEHLTPEACSLGDLSRERR